MSAREMAEWQVYAEFEPFGEEREDLRMGTICATLVNVNRGKGTPQAKPSKFIPEFRNWGKEGQKAAQRERVQEQVRETFMNMAGKSNEED